MGDYFACAKPNATELLGSIGAALIVFFLVAIPTIIENYHLTQAQEVLAHHVGRVVHGILASLDAFSFTSTLVTFLFWGIIGIFIYGFTTVLVHLWQAGEEDKEIISDEYVHPAGFSRTTFWKQIVEKEVFSAILLVAELIVIAALMFWAFPLALLRVAALFEAFSMTATLYVVLWAVIISSLFCLVQLIFKAWRYRHILFIV